MSKQDIGEEEKAVPQLEEQQKEENKSLGIVDAKNIAKKNWPHHKATNKETIMLLRKKTNNFVSSHANF